MLTVIDRQNLRQRGRLSRQPSTNLLGAPLPITRHGQCGLRGSASLLDPLQRGSGRHQCGLSGGLRAVCRRQCLGGHRLGGQPIVLGAQPTQFAGHATGPLLGLRQHLADRLGPRRGLRRRLGRAIGLRLQHSHRVHRRGCRLRRRLGPRVMARLGVSQRRVLVRQPRLGCLRIPPQLRRVPKILAKLLQPARCLGQRGAGAGFLGNDLLLGNAQPLQPGARVRLGLAQRRQRRLRIDRARLRLGRRGSSCRHRNPRRMQRRLRGSTRPFGMGALDRQQLGLGGTDRPRDITIPARLPRLALQRAKLCLELAAQILGPRQVGIRRPQLQLRLVPPRMQAGNPRRLLQQHAPLLGLGGDQRPDAPLADHRRAMRARRQVGEQRLHVARPRLRAVDVVGTAHATLDAADHLELRLHMERRRRHPGGVVQGQHHLGNVARRPGGGAGEDHVLHLAAAQAAHRAFPHRPAQRLDHVRLAAAVRPDDAGQARTDLDIRRLREALETGDAQTGKTDGQRRLSLSIVLGGVVADGSRWSTPWPVDHVGRRGAERAGERAPGKVYGAQAFGMSLANVS